MRNECRRVISLLDEMKTPVSHSFASSDSRRQVRKASWAGALLGLALGIPLSRIVSMTANASQLPGFAAAHGFSPYGYLLRLVLLVACPLVGAFLATLAVRFAPRNLGRQTRLETVGERRHPKPSASEAQRLGFTLALVAAHALVAWIFFVPALAGRGISSVLQLLALFLVSTWLAHFLGKGDFVRGAPFLSCSVVAFPLAFWGSRPAVVGVAAGFATLFLPWLGQLLLEEKEPLRKMLRVLAASVFLPGSVTALAAASMMGSSPIADIFEDGHSLLPASEYLRGELPYRDIVPGHGLLSDGLLQACELKLFGDDYRGLQLGNAVVGAAFWPSFFALGYVATGSPAIAFGGLLLSFLAFPEYFYLRIMPSIWVLTMAIHASRTKKRWAWFACGALVPVALCVGVEFAAYGAVAVLVALWVARGPRQRFAGACIAGILVSGSAIAIALARKGVLAGFGRTTFLFLPSLLPVYTIPLIRPAVPWPLTPRNSIAFFSDRTMFLYLFVTIAIAVAAALLPRAPAVGGKARPLLPVLAWVIAAMVSVVERRHIGYPFFLVPLALLLTIQWFRGARPWMSLRGAAGATILTFVALLWRPWHVAQVLASGVAHQPVSTELVALEQPERARGGLFPPADLELVRATQEFIQSAKLSPEETWLDFANAPGLYYLFNRNCPIRYYSVPFYESETAQAEVIATLERNPHVRAALITGGLPSEPIDGITNARRAPHVAAYLERNFRPFFRRGRVEFWIRSENPGPGPHEQ